MNKRVRLQKSVDRLSDRLKDHERLPFVKGFFAGKNALPKLDGVREPQNRRVQIIYEGGQNS